MTTRSKNRLIFQTIAQLKKAGKIIYALIYCRVSSERQKNEGHGLESQEARCREYARSNGYAVDEKMIFKDAASGGGEYTSRPGQVELIEFIDKHPYMNFVVIVDDISRVARDVQAHFQLRLLLRGRGVEVVSPNFNFEDSPEGEMMETIMAATSQYHRKGNKRQVVQKQKARLESGYWAFASKKPYKMEKDPVHGSILKPQYPESQWLKEAMEGFATGTFVRKVDACRFLVEKGYWKNQSPEKYIDKLTELFSNVLFAGYIEYPDWEVERRLGHHEALITLETYDAIQKRIKKEGVGKRIRLDISPDFPIRGLTLCSGCKDPLTAGWSTGRSGRYPFYKCQKKGCQYYGKSIRKKDIEDRFNVLLKKQGIKSEVGVVVEKVFDDVWNEEISDMKENGRTKNLHKKALKEKIRQLSELAGAAKSDTVRNVYETQIEEIANKIEQLESDCLDEIDLSIPYRTALDKANGLLKSPYSVWVNLDVREQHSLFYFIFEQKLPYDMKYGYRTDEIPTAVRLFEEFATTNSHGVEMTGIEPVCRRFL